MRKVNYSEKCEICCANCGTKLKANLAARKPEGSQLVCFSCHQEKANKTDNRIRTAREIRSNPDLRSIKRWDKAIPLKTVYA